MSDIETQGVRICENHAGDAKHDADRDGEEPSVTFVGDVFELNVFSKSGKMSFNFGRSADPPLHFLFSDHNEVDNDGQDQVQGQLSDQPVGGSCTDFIECIKVDNKSDQESGLKESVAESSLFEYHSLGNSITPFQRTPIIFFLFIHEVSGQEEDHSAGDAEERLEGMELPVGEDGDLDCDEEGIG